MSVLLGASHLGLCLSECFRREECRSSYTCQTLVSIKVAWYELVSNEAVGLVAF